MENSQSYAIRIEHIMCDAFECDRFGVGGLVDSDYISRHPFMAMVATLTYLCGRKDTNDITVVSNFFEKYNYYGDWSIDELLSFESDSKIINRNSYEIEYNNGVEAIESIIVGFVKSCDQLR